MNYGWQAQPIVSDIIQYTLPSRHADKREWCQRFAYCEVQQPKTLRTASTNKLVRMELSASFFTMVTKMGSRPPHCTTSDLAKPWPHHTAPK
jgi:hypothetical protein